MYEDYCVREELEHKPTVPKAQQVITFNPARENLKANRLRIAQRKRAAGRDIRNERRFGHGLNQR